jgi:hypothetical protein
MTKKTETIVLTYEEKTIANICDEVGVTYVIVKTGDELQSDTEKEEETK